MIAGVAGHADHFVRGVFFSERRRDVVSDWIASGEKLVGKRLINDSDLRGRGGVLRPYLASTQQRNADSGKIAGSNRVKAGKLFVILLGSVTFRGDVVSGLISGKEAVAG